MLIVKSLIGVGFQVALFATLLLLPAGTWNWPRANMFLAAYSIIVSASVFALAWWAPRGLEARLQAPSDKTQPTEDRLATLLIIVAFAAWFIFIPLDVFRLQLLPQPSLTISILGAIVCLAGLGIIMATIYQNEFVAPVVKDQSERGQAVVDTGLYGLIRHPMYSGMLVWLVGLGLWLESTAGALAAIAFVPCVLPRIRIEERTLRETLPGYSAYMDNVRYRLVPYIW